MPLLLVAMACQEEPMTEVDPEELSSEYCAHIFACEAGDDYASESSCREACREEIDPAGGDCAAARASLKVCLLDLPCPELRDRLMGLGDHCRTESEEILRAC